MSTYIMLFKREMHRMTITHRVSLMEPLTLDFRSLGFSVHRVQSVECRV